MCACVNGFWGGEKKNPKKKQTKTATRTKKYAPTLPCAPFISWGEAKPSTRRSISANAAWAEASCASSSLTRSAYLLFGVCLCMVISLYARGRVRAWDCVSVSVCARACLCARVCPSIHTKTSIQASASTSIHTHLHTLSHPFLPSLPRLLLRQRRLLRLLRRATTEPCICIYIYINICVCDGI